MPDTTSTPPEGTAPGATSVGVLAPAPEKATPEELAAHWEAQAKAHSKAAQELAGRHGEATDTIRKLHQGEVMPSFLEKYAKPDGSKPGDNAPAPATDPNRPVTFADLQERDLADRLDGEPNLKAHKTELKDLLSKGIEYDEAAALVRSRHGIVQPQAGNRPMHNMPTPPASGSRGSESGDSRSAEQKALDARQGVTDEMHQKHAAKVAAAWGKYDRRGQR